MNELISFNLLHSMFEHLGLAYAVHSPAQEEAALERLFPSGDWYNVIGTDEPSLDEPDDTVDRK